MSERLAVLAKHRSVLAIAGEDRASFLQGLVSNDVTKAGNDRAIWSAFLTPQGKYLHDFFLVGRHEELLVEAEAARAPDLARRLKLYKLRSKVEIDAPENWTVVLACGVEALATLGLPETPGAARPWHGGVAFVDPRAAEAGARLILPRATAEASLTEAGFTLSDLAAWDRQRLRLGLPDGTRDLQVEKTILLEAGFDELGGIDWQKGCWMGQELTARTKYRGLIKRRLLPVTLTGEAEPGTPVLADGKEVGELRSVCDGRALALLRLEAIEQGGRLTAGDSAVEPQVPDWLPLQRPAKGA